MKFLWSIILFAFIPINSFGQEVIVKQDGKVGIGTNSPEAKLDVKNGDIRTDGFLLFGTNSSQNNGYIGFSGDDLQLTNYNTSSIRLYTGENFFPMERMIINSIGNVGIGTSNPNSKLQVTGGDIETDGFIKLVNPNSLKESLIGFSDNDLLIGNFNATSTHFSTGEVVDQASPRLTITPTGNIGVGTTIPLDRFHVAQGNLRIEHQRQLRFEASATSISPSSIQMNASGFDFQNNTSGGSFSFFTKPDLNNSINALTINANGNVGIGGITPSSKLHVLGNASFNDQIKLINSSNTKSASLEFSNDNLRLLSYNNGTVEFWTSNDGISSNQRMVISNEGKVGIGTSLPEEKLHIFQGNLRMSNGHYLQLDNTTPNFGPSLIGMNSNALSISNRGIDGAIYFSTTETAGYNAKAIITAPGNLGIGTNEPNEKLEVAGNGRAFFGNGGGSFRKGLLLDGINGQSAARIEAYDYGTPVGLDLVINTVGHGNVGIDTSNPQSKLHVANGSARIDNNYRLLFETSGGDPDGNIWMTTSNNFEIANFAGTELYLSTSPNSSSPSVHRLSIESNGEVGIGTDNPTAKLSVNGTANKPGGGSWSVFSDLRSKKDISQYSHGLENLMQLNPVSFSYKSEFDWGEGRHVGLIAQEVEKVAPSMVNEIDVKGIQDFKQVDPNELTFMLINAVKELKKENDKLTERINTLEAKYKKH